MASYLPIVLTIAIGGFMDLTSDNCRKQFLVQRNSLRKKIEKAEFDQKEDVAIEEFNNICIKAAEDDPVAQDVLAYLFKKGLEDVLPVNYEKYMQWEILASSNGNQFALEKLSLFLSFAVNEILMAEDFAYIAKRNEIDKYNYQYIIGRLICDAIADELDLDPKKLIRDDINHIEFDAKTMRIFDKARNFAIPKVLNYLRS